MQVKKLFLTIAIIVLLVWGLTASFPWLFSQLMLWQREFNQLISFYLQQINQQPEHAGKLLIAVSFLYGLFHAIGPGHGKFIIASYLATHRLNLKTSVRLTFLSSFMQGLVAISLTSVVVLVLELSYAYFQLSQLWLARIAFGLIFFMGALGAGKVLNYCGFNINRKNKK